LTRFLLLPLALLLAGCPRATDTGPLTTKALSPDRSAGAFAQTDPWLLTTTDRGAARGNRGIFLGNGYLGATFGPDGGAGPNGACYVAGVYDKEVLAPIPLWNKLDLPANLTRGPYSQTLDMKRGVLITKMGDATVTSFVSRDNPNLAVIHVEGVPLPRKVSDLPAPPQGKTKRLSDTVTAFLTTHATLTIHVAEKPDQSGKGWTRFVLVLPETPSPLFKALVEEQDPDQYARAAYGYEARIVTPPYEEVLAAHAAAWAKLWEKDIVIEGDPEAQQLVHSLMFHLLCSVRPGGDDSIPPETWSGDFYKGHIFWDADVWMFPALLAQHPDLARCILDYRFKHLPEARRRAKAAGYAGADFPWESAASGREVAPGGFSQGRHVTAGVGWAHWQYWLATRDGAWLRERGWPVLSGVADYFASRAEKDAGGGEYEIRRVFGPDENKGTVDNNTYTNALARRCLLAAREAAGVVGRGANPRWAAVAHRLALPYDRANDRYLAREGDKGERTKQADGELILYPAALPMGKQTAAHTFDFHAARPIPSGPAMTTSIHALLAARLGRAQDAERYFRASYRPFVRGPFLLFSEKRSLDRCYFATGAGGVLQSVLYGFGGLDWEDFGKPSAAERRAALPPAWKRLTITGIRHGSATYRLEVTPESRVLTRR
jgi:trehalose/maltose hydrolase-like predicted phosphorylase